MTKCNLFPKLAIVVALASVYGNVALAADFSGSATASVVVPLSISEDTPMNFGSLGAGPVGGTVVLDQADGVSTTGDVNHLGGAIASGDFTITGEPSATYIISYGNGSLDTNPASGAAMSVSGINSSASGTIGVGGTEAIIVGGTLNVNGGQPAGNYSTGLGLGSPYTITINYN